MKIKNKVDGSIFNHLPQLAKCSISAFPDSLSSLLGEKYVAKILEWFLISNDRFLFWIELENNIVGFVGGAKGAGSTSSMLQHAFWTGFFAFLVRPHLIFNYSLIRKKKLIINNILKRISSLFIRSQKTNKNVTHNIYNHSMGLVVIGVNPLFRKQGVGGALLKGFAEKCVELGCKGAHLSVKTENYKAIKLYEKNGWKVKNRENGSLIMILKIS